MVDCYDISEGAIEEARKATRAENIFLKAIRYLKVHGLRKTLSRSFLN